MRTGVTGVLGVAALGVATVASAQTYRHTWTTTADFEDGAYRYTNVNATDVPDQLQLDLSQIETPYLWVSDTGSNTVAQVSTQTTASYRRGQVIRIASFSGATDPSRTAVDIDFNCWVGFRAGNAMGRLGAEDTGLDAYFPNSSYTSQGISTAYNYVRAVAINADGNIWVGNWNSTQMRLIEPASGRVVNTFTPDLRPFQSTDPQTQSYRPVVGGGSTYGFAVDAYGNLWISQRDNYVGQYDARTGEHLMTYSFSGFSTSFYGIGVDLDGNVWLGNWTANGVVYLPRHAVVSGQKGIEECLASPGPGPTATCVATAARRVGTTCHTSRGVAIDQAGTAWINCFDDDAVMQVADDGDGTPAVLGTFSVGDGPLGITATADGYIWTVNYYGGGPGRVGSAQGYTCPNGANPDTNNPAGTVTQLRGSNGSVVATYPTCGNNPYTYSDMAGYALRSVTLRSGWWRQIHDAGAARTGLQWGRLDWHAQLPGATATPPATRIQFSIGASDNLAALQSTVTLPVVVDANAETGGVDLEPYGLSGRYIAVEGFFFTRNDFLGPALQDVTVSSVCIPTSETCNGFDDDCNGSVDLTPAGLPLTGAACNTGLPGVCAAGLLTCQGGQFVCARAVDPSPEICDGFDNNCNNQVDEGVTNACGTCGPAPTEVCNGHDDDCDGLVDEGVQSTCLDYATCTPYLTCGACPPAPPELCDGLDNNCNGLVDEGSARGCVDYRPGDNHCGIVQVCGDCPDPPAETCNGIDDNCNGLVDEGVQNTCFNYPDCTTYQQCAPCPPGPPEQCDGLDNNCNGQIDEGVLNDCGTCGPAPEEVCDGIDNNCNGQVDEGVSNACGLCGPLPREVCDGIDNNCNGLIDEGVSNRCGTCGPEPFEVCNGLDDNCDGRIDEGVKNQCGTCGPVPAEVCDGVDNDCNGEIDEGTDAQCDADILGSKCVQGQCALPCFANECPSGQLCTDGYCLSDPCTGVTCASGYRCVDGTCASLCDVLDVTCEGDLVCIGGNCVENVCSNTGCPSAQVCVENQCVPDPCFNVTCETGNICQDGQCVPDPCLQMTCQDGFHCIDGTCRDPCDGVTCGRSERCEGGFCLANPCFDVNCQSGAVCVDGNCVESACVGVVCGDGQVCRGGDCFTTRVGGPCGAGLARCGEGLVCYQNVCRDVNDPELSGVLPGGTDAGPGTSQVPASGGCSCQSAAGGGGLGALTGLLLGAVAWRRRRRGLGPAAIPPGAPAPTDHA